MSKKEELLSQIEKFSEKYEFSFQFWGTGNNNVFIMKQGIDLYDSGGFETIEEALIDVLHYIYRINRVPEYDRVC